MEIYPYSPSKQDTATTYIAFKEYPTDTLKMKYQIKNGVAVKKIWYNGQLKWDASRNKKRGVLVITKHPSEN